MAESMKEKDLRDKIEVLNARVELLNSNAETTTKRLTDQGRVIDLLIMLGHLDEATLAAAWKLINTGLKL